MESKRSRARLTRRIVGTVLAIAVAVLLVAVAFVVVPMVTHESAGSSGQEAPADFISSVTATGDDGRTRVLEAADPSGEPADLARLHLGQNLVISGSGYDASIGIYVAICRIPDSPSERPSPCLGDVPENAEQSDGASAWVTNNWAWRPFASHSYLDAEAGTFEVTLLVPPASGEGLDCLEEACGIFTRADHTALDDRIQDLYLPVAFR